MSSPVRRFVVCLRAEDAADLQVRKLYELHSDAVAADRGYIRIVDDSGEDYLYPAEWFAAVELPRAVERALASTRASASETERGDKPLPRTAPTRRR